MSINKSHRILVLGGSASGKSLWAEKVIADAVGQKIYFATAQPFDDELRSKITLHKQRRGDEWKLIESPFTDGKEFQNFGPDCVVLFECLSTWLGNLMYANLNLTDIIPEFLINLNSTPAKVLIVSVEVGLGVIPAEKENRKFVQIIGELNQKNAAQADGVVLISAGLPLILKGKDHFE